jgi:hypothetical protein
MNIKSIFALISASGLTFSNVVQMITALMRIVESDDTPKTGEEKLLILLEALEKLLQGTPLADEFEAAKPWLVKLVGVLVFLYNKLGLWGKKDAPAA